MSAGVSGLAFIPSESIFLRILPPFRMLISHLVMIGAGIAFLLFLWYSSYHTKAVAANEPWAKVEEYRRLPLAAAGAPTYVLQYLI